MTSTEMRVSLAAHTMQILAEIWCEQNNQESVDIEIVRQEHKKEILCEKSILSEIPPCGTKSTRRCV